MVCLVVMRYMLALSVGVMDDEADKIVSMSWLATVISHQSSLPCSPIGFSSAHLAISLPLSNPEEQSYERCAESHDQSRHLHLSHSLLLYYQVVNVLNHLTLKALIFLSAEILCHDYESLLFLCRMNMIQHYGMCVYF